LGQPEKTCDRYSTAGLLQERKCLRAASIAGQCHIRTFTTKEVVIAKSVVGYTSSASSSALSSLRSGGSKTLAEPAIDRRQKVAGFGVAALAHLIHHSGRGSPVNLALG
jgi:hypothetical protein